MADRYYCETPITADKALLVGQEAHHLIHVKRAKRGAGVVLFDGSGAEFTATVQRIGRAEVELAVLSRHELNRELPLELTLAVALPKGDRQRWLAEKAVELGTRRIVPIQTVRSVAQPVRQALGRLRRTVIEASKQCGRNRLMEITAPQQWLDFVAETKDIPCRLLAHPGEEKGDRSNLPERPGGCFAQIGPKKGTGPICRNGPEGAAHKLDLSPFSSVLLAVGPEGGFTGEEVSAALAAGWQPVDLGPRTLRVETAAILLVARVAGA